MSSSGWGRVKVASTSPEARSVIEAVPSSRSRAASVPSGDTASVSVVAPVPGRVRSSVRPPLSQISRFPLLRSTNRFRVVNAMLATSPLPTGCQAPVRRSIHSVRT